MRKHIFYRLGDIIYPLRWFLIVLWLIILGLCVPLLIHLDLPFKSTGFSDENSESFKTQVYINQQLGYDNSNKFVVLYHSNELKATQNAFREKVKQSLSGLKDFPFKHEVILPSDNKKQISRDKHTAYAVIFIKDKIPLDADHIKQLEHLIKEPPGMTVTLGGEAIFTNEINKQTQEDLYQADFIATPVALITLLIIFGSITAALLPLLLGAATALMIFTSLLLIGQITTLSVYTLNIALLLGLCLSLDYALFIISRFREELEIQEKFRHAIAKTEATAGKAVFFSGLAVLASLSALFLFPVNILFSMAVGGVLAVGIAVINSLIILPALLAVLKTRINLFSIRFKKKKSEFNIWHWIAEKVVKRPLLYFFPVLIFLLMLGYPFLSTKPGISDHRITPADSDSQEFFRAYAQKFDIKELSPVILVTQSSKDPILSRKNISRMHDMVKHLKSSPFIANIHGVISSDSDLSSYQYYRLYKQSNKSLPTPVKKLLDTTTRKLFTLYNINSAFTANTPQMKKLLEELHQQTPPEGLDYEITGTPAINADVLHTIDEVLPYAILWIVLSSYFILLLLLRSIFLPFKAILMNILSLSACYGVLVLVFQDGWLAGYLNFIPQGMLDVTILVIIFCALFGFSMDYEVFLLTRIRESYQNDGHQNKQSIVFGLEKSSRIITSAALIVILICASFLVADVLMVKAFGLGIAVAIFVDAFLIRTLLVPATMALLEKWNWYLPRWLDRILPEL